MTVSVPPVPLEWAMGSVKAPPVAMLGGCVKVWYPLLVGLKWNGYGPCRQGLACLVTAPFRLR